MTHRGVHRAAAIVAVAPGQRTRLVEAGEQVRCGCGAELVPLVGALPRIRESARGGGVRVDDLHRPAGDAAVVALEACADQTLVPGPVAARVRRRVDADEATASADVRLEGG